MLLRTFGNDLRGALRKTWRIKVYRSDALPELDGPLLQRLVSVSDHCQRYPPETLWATDTESRCLLRLSRKIQKAARLLTLRDVAVLARAIDDAHGQGLVHGDIIRRNIVLTTNDCFLVDWEPCLKQYRNGRPVIMGTYPYIHPLDLQRGFLTRDTDLLCFQFLIESILEGVGLVRTRARAHHSLSEPVNLAGETAGEIYQNLALVRRDLDHSIPLKGGCG